MAECAACGQVNPEIARFAWHVARRSNSRRGRWRRSVRQSRCCFVIWWGSPRLPIALTRFRLPWRFDGREAVIASRATDDTGYVQPTREALIAARGTNSNYHFNGMKFWIVRADGTVTNVDA